MAGTHLIDDYEVYSYGSGDGVTESDGDFTFSAIAEIICTSKATKDMFDIVVVPDGQALFHSRTISGTLGGVPQDVGYIATRREDLEAYLTLFRNAKLLYLYIHPPAP